MVNDDRRNLIGHDLIGLFTCADLSGLADVISIVFSWSTAAGRASKSKGVKVQGGRIALVILILGLWEISTSIGWVDPFFVSSPSRIAGHLMTELTDYGFYRDLYVSAVEMAVGYAFGASTGIAAGVLLARWELVARIVDPFLIALNSIPRMGLAPLLIIWFGIDMMSKIVLAGTLVFFVMFSPSRSLNAAAVAPARREAAPGQALETASGAHFTGC